jgi:drug/metabolite transporter (DMT)-like permease
MHAGWNVLARIEKNEHVFIRNILIITFVVGFVPSIVAEIVFGHFSPRIWLCVSASGTCCGIYYFALARGYHHGDFTTVYPMSRAIPVILVVIFDIFRDRLPTPLGYFGLVLVVIGCLFAPLQSLREMKYTHYINRTGMWILITAVGTAGYTMLDKLASETIMHSPLSAARYCYYFFAISGVVYVLLLNCFGCPRKAGAEVGWKIPSIAALLNFGSYWLVVWAYQLSVSAGYVVAFRQFSIIVGVVLAIYLFREKGARLRLIGASIICAGLFMIGLWG